MSKPNAVPNNRPKQVVHSYPGASTWIEVLELPEPSKSRPTIPFWVDLLAKVLIVLLAIGIFLGPHIVASATGSVVGM
jgi:hypothetical protein